jgi:hypothetical protein
MLIEKLVAADAVERIKSATDRGGRILGIDGFRVVPEGFVASPDLILDLSTRPMARDDAAAAAISFVAVHEARDVVFEVVIERGANVR